MDQDTDRYVFEVNALHLRRKMENLESTVQWTDLVSVPPLASLNLGLTVALVL